MVNLYRQICQAKGRNYVAEMLPPFDEDETWCVYFLKTFFLILSCFGMEFRLSLARTGFLQDFVIEDLRHTKHLSSDALVSVTHSKLKCFEHSLTQCITLLAKRHHMVNTIVRLVFHVLPLASSIPQCSKQVTERLFKSAPLDKQSLSGAFRFSHFLLLHFSILWLIFPILLLLLYICPYIGSRVCLPALPRVCLVIKLSVRHCTNYERGKLSIP